VTWNAIAENEKRG